MCIGTSGRYLSDPEKPLVTNAGDASISSYQLNAMTGALTFIDNEVTAGSTPCRLVITPDNKFAFSGDSGSDVVTRLQIAADGTLTELGQAAVPGSGVAADVIVSPDGNFLTVLVPTENGGSGNDRINSRDKSRAGRSARDVVSCGAGRHDVAQVDRADRAAPLA